MRIETDFIGQIEIPEDALYGINSVRAKNNFPDTTIFNLEWYKAVGLTKLAVYNTYKKFKRAAVKNLEGTLKPISFIEDEIIGALIESASEISNGKYFENFISPAIQGGAGTSINLNVNEIISNVALQKLGDNPGNYSRIDPIEHANIYQSTNDVIPTSLTIAAIGLIEKLEKSINKLRFRIEKIESESRNILRIAYTQMQEAVPSSYGALFSTYNEALSRDWWRVSKCFERIKMVNLGGSAIGSGIAVPRFMIMETIQELQKLSKLPVTRSENMNDATNNLDSLVEVHAILKAHAVNLEKMVNDIRLLASDLVGHNEIKIPNKQVGSSIMPGKVNPVIPEYVISVAHKIYANDQIVTSLSAQGCLDLNAYLPLIGHSLLESIQLLITANQTLEENLFNGIVINADLAKEKLYKSPSITTALTPYIGYHKAAEIAKKMKDEKLDIFEANKVLQVLDSEKLIEIVSPQNLLKLGFSINEL